MALDAQAITRALGGRWQGRYGTARCPCHADKTASLKITDKPDTKNGGSRVDFHCFAGCDWKDVKAELVKAGIIPPWRATALQTRHTVGKLVHAAKARADARRFDLARAAAEADEMKRIATAKKLWGEAVPVAGTLGGAYLRVHRGFDFAAGEFDHCLRFHAGKKMLVELMTEPVTGVATGIQRVFLDDHGKKITRKMLGRAGVCRISPDEDVLEGLHLCEGFEDGIKVFIDGLKPVWACLSAGMMKSFPVLRGVECLNLIPDVDEVGKAAAQACAVVWRKAGAEVRILDDYFS
jgi:hypothetical protein